jgi:hypothetical protein
MSGTIEADPQGDKPEPMSVEDIEVEAVTRCVAAALKWADCSESTMNLRWNVAEGTAVAAIWDDDQMVIARAHCHYDDDQKWGRVECVNLITTDLDFVRRIFAAEATGRAMAV